MKSDRDIIVVGAGIGGLAIGALLAHGGRQVTVLERNSFLGGRCTSYEKQGYLIDTFVHMVGRCEKGPFGEIMRRVGRSEAIRWWHATPDSMPVCYVDDEPYPYPSASFSTRDELIRQYEGFGLEGEDLDSAMKIQDAIMAMAYEDTFDLDGLPYSEWLKQFTSNQTLLALEHQKALLFCVVTLKEAATGEFIRMMQNCEGDANVGYPLGGCIRIPQAMADVIRDHGGEVLTDAGVSGIICVDGRVKGVRLSDDRELTAPVVISNTGIRETVFRLVGEASFPVDYVEYVRHLTTGKLVEETPMGMIYLKLALDKPVLDAPLILRNVKMGAFEGSRKLMAGLVADQPPEGYKGINSFIPVTSIMDPELAPPGCQLVNFYGLAPIHSNNWRAWVDYHLNFLFHLYPGVKDHMLWYDFSTINRINQYSGRLFPDIIGIAQSVGQTGKNRPRLETPIEGLYLVGADVGQDNIGTELAAESALRLADILLK